MKELILKLHDFLKTDSVKLEKFKYNGDIGYKSDIFVSFEAVKVSDKKIYITGKIEGFIDLECSRCLNVYTHFLEIPMNNEIDVKNETVDVAEEVRQLLLLEMPMKPLCSSNCAGICKECGNLKGENNSCSCIDSESRLIKERWMKLLNKDTGGSENAKSKKKTYAAS